VQQAEERALGALRDRPAETADGCAAAARGQPWKSPDEVHRVKEVGAEGIGLYRSEFLLDAFDPDAVSEESQYETYRALLAAMHPLPVAIRTFDAPEERAAGRDRAAGIGSACAASAAELQHDDRLRTQLRALAARRSAGDLRILLPFVTSVDEIRAARQLIEATARELGRRARRAGRRDDRSACRPP
jgi:phosphotransferase system enzyme I (PtsI)